MTFIESPAGVRVSSNFRPIALYSAFYRALLAVVALLTPISHTAADEEELISPRLVALAKAVERGGEVALADFWGEMAERGTPLFEHIDADGDEVLVTFLWREEYGREHLNAGIAAGFNWSWQGPVKRLSRLEATDVWYATYEVEAVASFPYAFMWPAGRQPASAKEGMREGFAYAGAERQFEYDGIVYEMFRDPLGMNTVVATYDGEPVLGSYAVAPDAPEEEWLRPAGGATGEVVRMSVVSRVLGNARDIVVYTPPAYDESHDGYPFVLIFDGDSYLKTVEVPRLLNNMVASGAVPPMVAIMVTHPAGERGNELPPNPDYSRFVTRELLPYVRERFRITNDPRLSVIAGASYGGLASTWLAYRHPDIFGNVLSQSGSYWWSPGVGEMTDDEVENQVGWLPRKITGGEKLPIRFYLDSGTWENAARIQLSNRYFSDLLRLRGYDVAYQQFVGGHTYFYWRSTFPDGLIYLIGTENGRRQLELRPAG